MQTQTKEPQKIRVGFDLDGVLLYNPLRIGRPVISFVKRKILGQKNKTRFYIPHNSFDKFVWSILHKFSLYTSPGFYKIKQLVDEGKIEAYLVTARYSFLKADLDKFVAKNRADNIFTEIIHNAHNEQPHLYKERVISNLHLDYFIEDNWDIVAYLSKKVPSTRVIWMFNLFDLGISYALKVAHLKDAIELTISQKT